MTERPAVPRDIRAEMFSQRRKNDLLLRALEYSRDYLDKLDQRPVFPSDRALADLAVFDEPLPEGPRPAEEVLDLLHVHGSPAAVSQTGGRYFGFVCGGITPAALAAKWLADVWDQNPAMFVMSPVVAALEETCRSWLIDLLGLPRGAAAGLVSGTSMATLCGLAAGRNALLRKQGWEVNRQGMVGAPRLRVILSEQAHGTVNKALALLGFGLDGAERIPFRADGSMDVGRLPELDDHCLVIAQAGNVNTGVFDSFDEICDRAGEVGAWVHVDGAFGLWAAGSRSKRDLTRGVDRADSWSVDAHKTLNVPYDCGVVLCREPRELVEAMQLSGDYIQLSNRRDGMMYTPEMSRRSRAVELWATMRYLGRAGIEQLVDGLCDRAVQFAELLGRAGFRILNEVVFNQVLVACDSPEQTEATLRRIQASGECWAGPSTWQGEPVIRISVCSWATTPEEVERSAAAFVACRESAKVGK